MPVALGVQNTSANQLVAPINGVANDSDAYATRTPVLSFVDPASGQQYSRYVIDEPVPMLAYSYQEVKESVFVPKTVTELKTTTVTRYIPIQSQQLQLRTIPNWNPFAAPQQVWQYVPIVQNQAVNVQVTQPVSFQKWEREERTRMVPVFGTEMKQVPKFVDRPIGQSPSGGNTIAGNPNFYRQTAEIAQADRSVSRYPTRPISYPAKPAYANPGYQSFPSQSYVAQAPAPYYPIPGFNSIQNVAASPVPGGNSTSSQNLVIPAVPLQTNSMQPNSTMAPYAGPGTNGYSMVASNGGTPYANPAAASGFKWPTFATGTGSLFASDFFVSKSNANYVASNVPVTQPYLWGNGSQSGSSFRPNTSPYAMPPQNSVVTPTNSYRDPMQGGMPATVLR